MGLYTNFRTAGRSLLRRKTKNISAILAIVLGVTLLVGVQITSATLTQSFLTSLLLQQGEVDAQLTNPLPNGFLNSTDQTIIKQNIVPKPLGIMGVLLQNGPALVGSQFEPNIDFAGIPTNFSNVFGEFYNWNTNKLMNLSSLLKTNSDVVISSELAKNMNITSENFKPGLILQTEFTNLTLFLPKGSSTPIVNSTNFLVNLSIVGIYDSNHPGIGAMQTSNIGRVVMSLQSLQQFTKWGQLDRSTDRISVYYLCYKTNHFGTGEFSQSQLQTIVTNITASIPLDTNGKPIFSVTSARLTFYQISALISRLLSTFLTVLGSLIVATGLLLITNIQLMSVESREFQTGVLRAVGENRRGILYTYLIETIIQGVIGGIIGLVGGLIFGWTIAFYLAGLFGTGINSVTPVIDPNIVTFSVIIGVVIAIITGILPAIRASRVNIVEALRGIKTAFEEKSSRNYMVLGFIVLIIGIIILAQNGFIYTDRQPIWDWKAGWDTLIEQETIVLGLPFIVSGLGIILSRFYSRTKVSNVVALLIWGIPIFTYLVSLEWVTNPVGSDTAYFLLITVVEIIIGAVLLVGINLSLIMNVLRRILIQFNRLKAVAEISPALIASHRTRSTLVFAVFAVVLTLNVMVASLVATESNATLGSANSDARGVDFSVALSKPSNTTVPYAAQIYQLDNRITDVIPFRTCIYCLSASNPYLIATKNPNSTTFDPSKNLLPVKVIEVKSSQIRGNATNANDPNWRYDYYLSDGSYPDGVRQNYHTGMSDSQLLYLSRESWDSLFNTSYKMSAYNVSNNGIFGGGGGFIGGGNSLANATKLPNSTNPIVFTDSFLIPLGTEIWLPMNSTGNVLHYQAFTVGGRISTSRAGGFPLTPNSLTDRSGVVGSIFIPNFWTQYTSFLGNASGYYLRALDAYDSFLVKTSLPIQDPAILTITQKIETFTNTNNAGYRALIHDNLIRASCTTVYSTIESNLQTANQITNFLQIYVSFGLIIGAVGMAVISVRNVAERKREIGMMRAIGFPRFQVILSVLLELLVLGIIGLIIGVVNGLLISYGLSKLSQGVVVVPWDTIIVYLGFISLVALIAGILPGWRAARIPASEALRYVG